MNTASKVAPQSLTRLPKPGRNPLYLRFIRQQPCCVSGVTWTVEAAHTGPRGLGTKANDLDALPLSRELHRQLHQIGPVAFQLHHRVLFSKLISELQERAKQAGVDLDPLPKRKGFGRAFGKTRSVGRCG